MATQTKARSNNMVLSLMIFGAILLIVSVGSLIIAKNGKKDQMQMTQKNIERAVVHCYALEGEYPPNLKYIEDNYGVVVNHEKYVVTYDAVAGNIRPDISVVKRDKKR